MPRSRSILLVFVAGAVVCLALSTASAGRRGTEQLPPEVLGSALSGNLFLRQSFDTDSKELLGRFVRDDDLAPDEVGAMATRCSGHITWAEEAVDAGAGQTISYMVTSEGAARRLGLPWDGARARETAFSAALVRYTETRKWRAVVDDPAALDDCCKRYPDQCARRYVGEMIEGRDGAVFSATGRRSEEDGRGAWSGGLVRDGWEWELTRTFSDPVWFAFRLTERAGNEVEHECPGKPWWEGMTPDGAGEGKEYFVGRSSTGREAIALALEAAREDAVKQASQRRGGVIVTWAEESSTIETTSGGRTHRERRSTQDGHMESSSIVVGLTPEQECWSKIEDEQSGYRAGVLAWLPVSGQ